MDKFKFETLTTLINNRIQLKDGNNNHVDMTIEKVSRPRISNEDYDAFSVDLSSPESVHCPSGNYLFQHESFGETELFMSPYDGNKYQIVVARKK